MAHSSLADLVSDLDHAIESGDAERRRDMLRRITDLLVVTAPTLAEPHMDVFGEVIGRLADDADDASRQRLSEQIAPIVNAPRNVVVDLAMDAAALVARPVLATSPVLSDDDLVRVAEERGQAHMLAIAERATISERVSDTLVHRGDSPVLRVVAANSGARFSGRGLSKLVEHAEGDTVLATTLQARADLPPVVSSAISAHMTAREHHASAGDMARHIHDVTAPTDEAMRRAIYDIDVLIAAGTPCDESMVLNLAAQGKHDHTLAAFGKLCELRPEIVSRLGGPHGVDCILINGKAAALSWKSVRTTIVAGRHGGEISPREMAQHENDYRRLSTSTSRRIVRFWKTREVAARSGAA